MSKQDALDYAEVLFAGPLKNYTLNKTYNDMLLYPHVLINAVEFRMAAVNIQIVDHYKREHMPVMKIPVFALDRLISITFVKMVVGKNEVSMTLCLKFNFYDEIHIPKNIGKQNEGKVLISAGLKFDKFNDLAIFFKKLDWDVVLNPEDELEANALKYYAKTRNGNDYDEVLDNIFVGGLRTLQNEKAMERFDAVLTLLDFDQINESTLSRTLGTKTRMRVPVLDRSEEMDQYIDVAVNFLKTEVDAGKKVLVHCYSGISRSATIVVAYMLKHKNFKTTESAIVALRERRPIIHPCTLFVNMLKTRELNKL